jgi:hypothetical protein
MSTTNAIGGSRLRQGVGALNRGRPMTTKGASQGGFFSSTVGK